MSGLVILSPGHSGPGEVGAPGERRWAIDLADMIHQRLEDAGVPSVIVPSWYHSAASPLVFHPQAAFLSLHYDAGDGSASGYFGDTDTRRMPASLLLLAWWEAVYSRLGIPYQPARRNANTRQFYGWRQVHVDTPRVICEHGFGAGADRAVLVDRLGEVAEADAEAIRRFLGRWADSPDTVAALRGMLARAGSERDRAIGEIRPKEWQKQQYAVRLERAIGILNRAGDALAPDDVVLRHDLNAWWHRFVVEDRWFEDYRKEVGD